MLLMANGDLGPQLGAAAKHDAIIIQHTLVYCIFSFPDTLQSFENADTH